MTDDKEKQLLTIDVGNTNITYGLFKGSEITHQWRTQMKRGKTSDEYGIEMEQILHHFGFDHTVVSDVIIGSVVPDLMHTLPAMCQRFLKKEPYIVGEGTKSGINIRLENPRAVGADRIVNAVAGFEKYGGPLIIVDIGTAITLDVIDCEGDYLGGSIAPGIAIAAEALFTRTSKLPKVELVVPDKAIGKNTIEAMQAGLVYGYIGLIDGLVEETKKELADICSDTPAIIATGGYSALLAKNSKYIERIDKDLTLVGLRLIYERTKAKSHE